MSFDPTRLFFVSLLRNNRTANAHPLFRATPFLRDTTCTRLRAPAAAIGPDRIAMRE